MGWKNEKGEHMEWNAQNTKALVEIIYNRMKKKQLQQSTFETEISEDINNEFKNITGVNFGVDGLKKKFARLHFEYKYEGGALQYKFTRHEIEHEYDMLVEIFEHIHSMPARKLDHVSTQDPPTVDEERAVEEAHLSKVVRIDLDSVGVHGDNMQEFDKKRKYAAESSSEYQHKKAKNSRLETLEAALSNSTESINGKTEASKVKADRYKSQADSAVLNPYSIEACMELLDSMEDVPSKFYNNALVKFKDKDWRLMFIKMPSFRRMDWLASLE